MNRLFAVLLLMPLAVSCVASQLNDPTVDQMEQARAVCESPDLVIQLVSLNTGADRLDKMMMSFTPVGENEAEQAFDVRDRIRALREEISPRYGALNQSCKELEFCQDGAFVTGGDANCAQQRQSYNNAVTRFRQLPPFLRDIESDAGRLQARADAREKQRAAKLEEERRASYEKRRKEYDVNRDRECDCTENVGGIFSSCC